MSQTKTMSKLDAQIAEQLRIAEETAKAWQKLPKRLVYATRYHQIKRGRNLSFSRRQPLLDFYTQVQVKPGAQTVVRKCVQCGISEFLILDTLFTAGELGLWTMYTLPTKVLRDRFVRMRVDPVISGSDFYLQKQQEAVGTVDGVGSKFFGRGAITFVGSNSEKEFIEFPADRVVIDEYDQCNEKNLRLAVKRYSASEWKILYKVGNPTIANVGISRAYENSKKKDWHVKCDSCNHWQPLNWFSNVVRQVDNHNYEILDTEWVPRCGRDVYPMCIKCAKPLDRFGDGQWVAEDPDHPVDGYTISQLYSPTTTLEALLFDPEEGFFKVLTHPGKLGAFYNANLGLPYSPPGTSLTYDILKSCEGGYPLNDEARHQVTMGVDVGKVLNVVISDHPPGEDRTYRRLLYANTIQDFEQLDFLMAKYNVQCCVVDAMPETREAKRFQARFPGRVWLCQFYKTDKITDLKLDDDARVVLCDRTQTLDSMVSQFLDGTRVLPNHSETLDGGAYYAQMQAPQRRPDEETKRYYWDEGSSPDHYFLADSYDWVSKALLDRGVNACLALSDYRPHSNQPTEIMRIERERVSVWLYEKPINEPKTADEKRAIEDRASYLLRKGILPFGEK